MALDAQFWQGERAKLFELLAPHVAGAATTAAAEAFQTLQPLAEGGVGWDVVNADAQQWAEQHATELAQGLTDTTREQVRQAVSDWIASGEPLPALTEALEPVLGATRAALVGVTEVTAAFHNGNLAVWQASPLVSGFRFVTVQDGTVCDLCAPLDGQTFALDDDGNAPPIHPRCRCYSQPVVDTE